MFVLFRNMINEWWQQQQIQHKDESFMNSSANDSDKQSSVSYEEIRKDVLHNFSVDYKNLYSLYLNTANSNDEQQLAHE